MTIIPTPDWWWGERAVPENGIAIDSCIADVVEELWGRGVKTAGSCCGHGNGPPSLIFPTHDQESPALCRSVLAEIDDRAWLLEQWRLVDVSESS